MDTDEKLLGKFIQSHTIEVVHKIEELPEKDIAALLESFSAELSALLLSQMDRFTAMRSLEKMDLEKAILLMEKLPFQVAEVFLRQINLELRNAILTKLPEQVSDPLQQILTYPKNSVGAFINPNTFTLYEDQTVRQGLEKIKKNNPLIETQIFILNRNQTLLGSLELKELITNDDNNQIRSLGINNLPWVSANQNISDLKDIWGSEWNLSHLPVLNSAGIFLGVITKESLAKNDPKKSTYDHHAHQTIGALGDLYKIGISGLFRSAAELVGNENSK